MSHAESEFRQAHAHHEVARVNRATAKLPLAHAHHEVARVNRASAELVAPYGRDVLTFIPEGFA